MAAEDGARAVAVPGERAAKRDFDTTVAHPARIWDYWLRGKDNFKADREAARRVLEAMPGMPHVARAGRRFLATVVHYLAAERGVRQFLDIGTGLPTANNTHEVAQRVAPESRIVYVDNDPIVLAHARALLTSDPRGQTSYIEADLRETDLILAAARRSLDFSQPIALMLLAILHFIPDQDDPWDITARLLAPLPPGSYMALSHGSSDLQSDTVAAGVTAYNRHSAVRINTRTEAEVTRFFDGLEIVPPGVVPLGLWRPGGPVPVSGGLPTYTALGRKP